MENKWCDNVYRIFDVLRFPLVLLIVFIHCKWIPDDFSICWQNLDVMSVYNIIRMYISSVISVVAVPIFFLISGYLFYNNIDELTFKSYMGKIVRRLKNLIVPYFFWIIMFIIGNILMLTHNIWWTDIWEQILVFLRNHGGWHIFFDCQLMDTLNPEPIGFMQDNSAPLLVPMWFVRDLFIVSLFSPILWWSIKKVGCSIVLILGICNVFSIWPYIHGVSVQSFFFFSLGILLSLKSNKMDDFFQKYGLLLIIVYILSSLGILYLMSINYLLLSYLGRFYTIWGTITVLFIAYNLIEWKYAWVLQWLAKSSFFVYASHMVFISHYTCMYVCSITGDDGNNAILLFVNYLIVPLLISFVCVSSYFCIRHFCPKLLIIMNGGR